MAGTTPQFLTAIDVGTTHCSVAFLPHHLTSDRSKIDPIVLRLDYAGNRRVPSCILFDPNGKKIAFGYEARDQVTALNRELRPRHHYFENVKMHLQHKKDIDRYQKIFALNGKQFFLVDVIAHILHHLKDRLLTVMRDFGYKELKASDIDWVITIPAFWGSEGKKMMREAGYMAGLCSDSEPPPICTATGTHKPPQEEKSPEKLLLALEPESAAVHCRRKAKEAGKGLECLVKADRYLVVDIGGGTADIASHAIVGGCIVEIAPPAGNFWGGTTVNEEFSKFLGDFVDDPEFSRYIQSGTTTQQQHKADLNKLLYGNNGFESQKMRFGSGDSEDTYHIEFPHSFWRLYEDSFVKKGRELESKKDMSVQVEDDGAVMRIQSSKMAEFFQPAMDGITNLIESHLKENNTVDTIYLVGGFGGCKYLHSQLEEKINETFRGYKYHFAVPPEPELAVIRGAAAFCCDLEQNPSPLAPPPNPPTITPAPSFTGKLITFGRNMFEMVTGQPPNSKELSTPSTPRNTHGLDAVEDLDLESIPRDELVTMLRKQQKQFSKLHKVYKNLQHEHEENEKKISQMREEQALNHQAKAHREAMFQIINEEKDEKINVLQTQIKLLKEQLDSQDTHETTSQQQSVSSSQIPASSYKHSTASKLGCEDCEKLKKELQEMKQRLYDQLTAELRKHQGDFGDSRSADEIGREFYSFFIVDVQEALKDVQQNRIEVCEQLCSIFQAIYSEVSKYVVERVTEKLNGMFVLGAVDEATANDMMRAYARLLSAANLTGRHPDGEILREIQRKLQEEFVQLPSIPSANMQQFITRAIDIAWSLARAVPPLISSCDEHTFRGDLHEKSFDWDDECQTNYKLTYVRPVLYANSLGAITQKGRVRNAKLDGAAGKEDCKYIGMNKEGATSIASIETSPTIQESSAQHHGYRFPPGMPVGGGYKEKGKEESDDEGTNEESNTKDDHLIELDINTEHEASSSGPYSMSINNDDVLRAGSTPHRSNSPPTIDNSSQVLPISNIPISSDTLAEKDLLEVTDYLLDMDKTHIHNLGLVLGLTRTTLEAMMDSTTFLEDVIAAWLREEDGVKEKGEPTWTVLVNALKHPRVGQIGIANDIAEDKGSLF